MRKNPLSARLVRDALHAYPCVVGKLSSAEWVRITDVKLHRGLVYGKVIGGDWAVIYDWEARK